MFNYSLIFFFVASSVFALKCFLPRTSNTILQSLLDSNRRGAHTLTPTSDIMAQSVALLAASQISRLKRAALNNSPRRRRANFTLSPYALRQSRRRHPGSRLQSNLLSVKKKKGERDGRGWRERRGRRRTTGGQFVRLEAKTEKESDGGRAKSSTCLTVIGDITYTNNEAEDDNIPCMTSVFAKAVLTRRNGTLNHAQCDAPTHPERARARQISLRIFQPDVR